VSRRRLRRQRIVKGFHTMMISAKMNKALNQQVTNELNASFSYLAMSFAFNDMGLRIFGERFKEQADEERGHAMKITGYIQEVGGKVCLDALAKPKSDYDSAQSMVEAALASEETVTKQINNLVALAETEKDYATRSFLQWYVDEQVEEVSSMSELLQMVKMAGEVNLFLVEGRLAKTTSAG
jgi:ferritin